MLTYLRPYRGPLWRNHTSIKLVLYYINVVYFIKNLIKQKLLQSIRYNNEKIPWAGIAYPKIYQEQWMSRRALRGPDTLHRYCSSNRDRVCSYQDPNPNSVRCCPLNFDSQRYVTAHPPWQLLPLRAYLVASYSKKAPIHACPWCTPPCLVCNLYFAPRGVDETSTCRPPENNRKSNT